MPEGVAAAMAGAEKGVPIWFTLASVLKVLKVLAVRGRACRQEVATRGERNAPSERKRKGAGQISQSRLPAARLAIECSANHGSARLETQAS